jgi:hypothetical protein
MCHEYAKDFLISGALRIAWNENSDYTYENQGIAVFSGKQSKVEFYFVERSG